MTESALLCWCRAGFEPELAAELNERAAIAGHPGYARTQRNSGYVEFIVEDANALSRALPWSQLIFARQKLVRIADLSDLNPADRITPMLAALDALGGSGLNVSMFGELLVEHPDSDEGKQLSGLARSFGNALRPALRKAGWLSKTDDARRPRLHVAFVAGDHAMLALSDPLDSSPWPLGIPRLRMHPDAPSRSALKLEEALLTFLDADERQRRVRDNMQAADLGAAPGGWTWVLMRNGMMVTSVDNGPLKQELIDSGRVDHLRADGFTWQPRRTLDWMVCDMVESPARVAERMATWFRENWCRQAIFNLKLPMKKRWEETRICLEAFEHQAHRPLIVRARQLYHDREEITVFATPK
ncbi:23S rRNA (cytidine(2498)-2'-O)-methyltransferase RlmM [Lysobacter capsici]|jgi:23S rRNA (cytidine2498-2'-O)-methyltransferase|uniref:Ribosomal RNA large subunit methyltransferase M n=1 Tax=Lysobacter capsici AZ78 TaxID=1444315 RepID=A0A120AHZ0_9GAMM|nr:23S rRNA (cytidine(2498)-2'-O)-methyltransferase RlmM [Lysobacter capsici]ALN87331.1 23S rRNA 2'-O-ribose C2498 methyltransferase [Lysobacter capsici]ATE73124.1 23S rRNA (cytidine(2498)-2'-O)-methyltransferase RlmM [Lysobacter capsici]KWS06890.1 LSU rRNA 2'-O-methyl-C2498 methyltransferase RlmM [Lysobacter capsici AZ78]UOF13754.1 23S rRNA (cytidine(2498)-2'-O)-methyltransferase RlmM [Lysobacter capsici]